MGRARLRGVHGIHVRIIHGLLGKCGDDHENENEDDENWDEDEDDTLDVGDTLQKIPSPVLLD